jgi:FkbM family methyltransferase
MSNATATFATKYGNMMCYKNDEAFVRVMSQGRLWEQELVENVLQSVIAKSEMILDVGAHVGGHSVMFAKINPSARIMAFEPQQQLFILLHQNVTLNHLTNQVELHQRAVGHRVGPARLASYIHDGYNAPVCYDGNRPLNLGGLQLGNSGEPVKMWTIDALMLDKCDFIKMDVEGSEILVLHGARRTIKQFKPVILFECTDKCVSDEMEEYFGLDRRSLGSPVEFLRSELGYKVEAIGGGNYLATPSFDSNDAIVDLRPRLVLEEFTRYSESGEDGILKSIFNCIGATNRYYVEFGVEDGCQCNTRALREQGWTGLLMDTGFENSALNLHQHKVTPRNVQALFAQYGVPKKFDLLSIDIDSLDLFVWQAIIDYMPRVVVIEYNAAMGCHSPLTVAQEFIAEDTIYFGASLPALNLLGHLKGYELVYCNEKGVNAFFIRYDLSRFYAFERDASKIYKPARYPTKPINIQPFIPFRSFLL